MNLLKNKKTFIIFILLFMNMFTITAYSKQDMDTAVILKASNLIENQTDSKEVSPSYQNVTLKITSGKFKGQTFTIKNNTTGNSAFDIIVKTGEKVFVYTDEKKDGKVDVFIIDYYRQDFIYYLTGLFALSLILVGRGKGVKSLITLALTMFGIIKILLPLILKGYNPVPITIALSIAIIIFTMFIIAGINSKSISAIIGTSSGVLLAGLISYFIGSKIRLTGLSSDEASMLLYIPQQIHFDFKSLLFAGIILGALGAVMDVGISIASAVDEINRANKNLSTLDLFSAGMNVGRDIMGTMANTLILAYSGSAIPLLLLFMAYQTPLKEIINLDVIATEIVRSLAASTGLVAAIPLTALASGILSKKNKN
ncbi:MAG: YibE/F family protein [Thermoanaerobacteraceae bacterium]